MGLSRGDYFLEGAEVHAEVTLRADESPAASGDAAAYVFDRLDVDADGAPCAVGVRDASADPPDGLRLRAVYACPHTPRRLTLRFGFLAGLSEAHRHLASVHLPVGTTEALVSSGRPDLEVDVAQTSRGFWSLTRGGVEHICRGADHLAFLLALLLGSTLGDRVRAGPLLGMLTAFTVGHSAALALATLGGFAPGARLVEPAVALSVAYVGAENLFTREVRGRWMLTLPFGFVHGFAFAGGLLPLGLSRQELPRALFAFNVGVEIGQLAVIAAFLPLLVLLRRRPAYPSMARLTSAGVAIAGVVWFVRRVV